MKRLLTLTTAALLAGLAPPATAGTYEVKACFTDPGGGPAVNASWAADMPYTPYVAAYTACPGEGIVTRMSGGTGSAPYGAGARHAFTAPPGTRIVHFRGNLKFNATRGWYAGFVDSSPRWIWCGANCTSFDQYWGTDFGTNTRQLFAQVTCGNGSGCPRATQDGILAMRDVVVTVADDSSPAVAITGGSLLADGWISGDRDVHFSSSDASGIRSTEVLVDGKRAGLLQPPCSEVEPRPCRDLSDRITIPKASFQGDGRHFLVVRSTDGAGNVAEASRVLRVDNTPPGQPLGAALVGGDAWRARNAFSIGWRAQSDDASPITAVRYSLCPANTPLVATQGCTDGRRAIDGTATLRDLSVPAPGDWRLGLWLEDAAGNADPQRASVVPNLRYDDQEPELAIEPRDGSDPTRVRVSARDAVSGVASGQVEARRDGEDAWRTLPTVMEKNGFSATLNDEMMPKGRYQLRARAVDHAGNERSTELESDGGSAARTLPLRIGTRLAVGKARRTRARGANGRHRYRTVLELHPQARYGRTIPLAGRLTMPGANPVAGADVEVWERVKLPAADWRRVSIVRTTRTGRFKYRALRGPSRSLKFRYPGTATVRARSQVVELGVRAISSFRATRARVVNGEEIRFHGRLKGRQSSETGKLLHLQVFTRGRWSTFATPRANSTSGLWSQPYRFTATRGTVRYRFRLVIPREESFPYETGVSRSVRVTVRGL